MGEHKKTSLRRKLIILFDKTKNSYTEWELFDIFRDREDFYSPGSFSRICRGLNKAGMLRKRIRTGTDNVEFYK